MTLENKKHHGTLNRQEAELITKEFGRFLSQRQPIIKDAGLLPYPKSIIMKALLLQQEFIRDNANTIKEIMKPNLREQMKKYFDSLGFCRVELSAYSNIEPENKEAVCYFNSFSSIRDVPEDRKVECVELITRYMSKGTESDMPSQVD